MFIIETRDFTNRNFDKWELQFDYHCVYILESKKQVYVGETNNIERRAVEHCSDSERNRLKSYKFNKIHIIQSELFEPGPAFHFERILIKLMRIDGLYEVVNGNDGKTTHYQRANMFELHFDDLWVELEKMGLVKAREFRAILNSGVYKYSPYNVLTEKQEHALNNIMNVINTGETKPHKDGYEARPILIEGDAGTGKTVVATSLFYRLKTDPRYRDKKIALVYPTTAMREEIQKVFKETKHLNKSHVIAPIDVTKKFYDIVICDEAHKLRRAKNIGFYITDFRKGNQRMGLCEDGDELDWILNNSGCQVLFVDNKQIAAPRDISHDYFMERLKEKTRGIRPVLLDEQMRIQAGDGYVSYIHDVLHHKTEEPKIFENYDFKLFVNFSDMFKLIRKKDEAVGLSRLCGGYAWQWKDKGSDTWRKIVIDGIEIDWNGQTSGWLSNLDCKNEMGSVYTLVGLDLNYAGVVIGPDLTFDTTENKIAVNKKEFHDKEVKKGVSDADLKAFILNSYAILLTRGIKGTFVYVCDDKLREYFEKFIPIHQ